MRKLLKKYKEAIAGFFVITMVLSTFTMVLCFGALFPHQYKYDILMISIRVLGVSSIFAIASYFIREEE